MFAITTSLTFGRSILSLPGQCRCQGSDGAHARIFHDMLQELTRRVCDDLYAWRTADVTCASGMDLRSEPDVAKEKVARGCHEGITLLDALAVDHGRLVGAVLGIETAHFNEADTDVKKHAD